MQNQRTVFHVLDETASRFSANIALFQPAGGKGKTEYQKLTWAEYRDQVREVACGLHAIGIRKGDIVALDSETRAEFYLADIGVMSSGAVAAALYTSLPPEERARNVSGADAKAMIVESPRTMELLRKHGAPSDIPFILLTGQAEDAISLADLRARGRAAAEADPALFDRIRASYTAADHAILYLTSGATGQPKMGLVTHDALVSNIDMGPKVLPVGPEDRTIAFLPSAHIAQRVVMELLPIRHALPVYFSEGLTRLPLELRTIKPTFLLAPPRVWERIFASISTEIKKRPAAIRTLFYTALGLGLKAANLRHDGKPIPGWMRTTLGLADRIVFRKIRERLGGELRFAISGAAPLGRELAQFFEAIGMPLAEGYGLTEGGVVALNPLDETRAGSIGKPLPGVEIKLSAENELLVKAPCLFWGYYKDPESTAAVLQDGWLHTGDIAEVDAQGYIYITGRKKELIVSSNGKKIYPARIESLFKTEPLVNQVLLLGDRQPYVTALFTINAANAETLEGMSVYAGKPPEEVVKAPAVEKALQQVVQRVNKQLAPFEHIKRYKILDRDFSIEAGEVTPTMKVRRAQVIENYRHLISELYLGKEEMA